MDRVGYQLTVGLKVVGNGFAESVSPTMSEIAASSNGSVGSPNGFGDRMFSKAPICASRPSIKSDSWYAFKYFKVTGKIA